MAYASITAGEKQMAYGAVSAFLKMGLGDSVEIAKLAVALIEEAQANGTLLELMTQEALAVQKLAQEAERVESLERQVKQLEFALTEEGARRREAVEVNILKSRINGLEHQLKTNKEPQCP